jgi:hypothetical protein
LTTDVFIKLFGLAVCMTLRTTLFLKKRWESLVLALIACVFLLGFAPYMVRKELRYRDQGVSTTAQVNQKERHYSRGRSGGWHNTLNYRYQDPTGHTIEGQSDVPLSDWEQSEEGHNLAIVYLRDEPSESRLLVDYSPFGHWLVVLWWTCFWLGAGLFYSFKAIAAYCQ